MKKFDIIILFLLLGIFLYCFQAKIRLIRIENDTKFIKEYLEPQLPEFNIDESH